MSTENEQHEEAITQRKSDFDCPICGNHLIERHQKRWVDEELIRSFIDVWMACDHCETTFELSEWFSAD